MEDDSSSSAISSSVSEEDDEYDDLLLLYNIFILGSNRDDLQSIPKITHYVEHVIPGYSNDTFKEHFRYCEQKFLPCCDDHCLLLEVYA